MSISDRPLPGVVPAGKSSADKAGSVPPPPKAAAKPTTATEMSAESASPQTATAPRGSQKPVADSGDVATRSEESAASGAAIVAPLAGMDSQAIDTAFFELETGAGVGQEVGATDDDLEAARQLFAEMAVDYMFQVRDFMIEVKWGDAETSWAERCEPAVQTLDKMAKEIGFTTLSAALSDYQKVLTATRESGVARISPDAKAELLDVYARLVALLPRAFEVDAERDRREPLLVEALLRQALIPRLAIEKLYAAGLMRLDAYFRASPDEVASVTGLSPQDAQLIVATFRQYREDKEGALLATPNPRDEYRRLKEALSELLHEDQAYERACKSWTKEALAEKRIRRRTRKQTIWKIRICLVRLGDSKYAEDIGRQCCKQTLESVYRYLVNAARAEKARQKEQG